MISNTIKVPPLTQNPANLRQIEATIIDQEIPPAISFHRSSTSWTLATSKLAWWRRISLAHARRRLSQTGCTMLRTNSPALT